MKVLVACEESQAVCKAFREKGHEAYSCDIQDCSGGHPEWHIKTDVRLILNPHRTIGQCDELCYEISFHTQDGKSHNVDKWDLIIAHPPCTYMSNAGACRMYPRKGQIDADRLKKGMAAKEFFMMFYKADCDRICIENPLPLKVIGLPKESQTIQPYMFGEPYSKRTLLWLKGLPNLIPTDVCESWKPYLPSGTSRNAGTDYNKGTASGSKNRSKTFPGVAKAMAEQWGKFM